MESTRHRAENILSRNAYKRLTWNPSYIRKMLRPALVESQSCEIYDFVSNPFTTLMPVANISQPTSASIEPTTCGIFDPTEFFIAKPVVKLPHPSTSVVTFDTDKSSYLNPEISAAVSFDPQHPAIIDAHNSTCHLLPEIIQLDEPGSPTFSGETLSPAVLRTPSPEIFCVELDCAIKDSTEERKVRHLFNSLYSTIFLPSDDYYSFPDYDDEEDSDVPSLAFSYGDLNRAINSAAKEFRIPGTTLKLSLTCPEESDNRMELKIGDGAKPSEDTIVSGEFEDAPLILSHIFDSMSPATEAQLTKATISSFTNTNLGTWAEEGDEDDGELYHAFWNKHNVPTGKFPADGCSTCKFLESNFDFLGQSDITFAQQLLRNGRYVSIYDQIVTQPHEDVEFVTPQDKLNAARHRLENDIEYHEFNYDEQLYFAAEAQPKLKYSARQVAQTFGNCSFDLFETSSSTPIRLGKLRMLRGSSLSLSSNRILKAKKREADEDTEDKRSREVRHYWNTVKNDTNDQINSTDNEVSFSVHALAIRKAEFYSNRKLLDQTATTRFEYEWAVSPDSVCADFAAISLVATDCGDEHYSVWVVNDPDNAHLNGTYKHHFYEASSTLGHTTVANDINRRFCLLRAAVWHLHDWTWSKRSDKDKVPAHDALASSHLNSWQATAAFPDEAIFLQEEGAPYRIIYRKRDFHGNKRWLLNQPDGWKTYPEDVKTFLGKSKLSKVETLTYDDAVPVPVGENISMDEDVMTGDQLFLNLKAPDASFDRPFEVDVVNESPNAEVLTIEDMVMSFLQLEDYEEPPRSPPLPSTPRTPRSGTEARPNAPTPSRGVRDLVDDIPVYSPTPRRFCNLFELNAQLGASPVRGKNVILPPVTEEDDVEGDEILTSYELHDDVFTENGVATCLGNDGDFFNIMPNLSSHKLLKFHLLDKKAKIDCEGMDVVPTSSTNVISKIIPSSDARLIDDAIVSCDEAPFSFDRISSTAAKIRALNHPISTPCAWLVDDSELDTTSNCAAMELDETYPNAISLIYMASLGAAALASIFGLW